MGVLIKEFVDGHCCYVCTMCKVRLFLSNDIELFCIHTTDGECYGVPSMKNIQYTKTNTLSSMNYSQSVTMFDYDSPLCSEHTSRSTEVSCRVCGYVIGWFHRNIHIVQKSALNIIA